MPNIKQTVIFKNATPKQLYEAILDPKKHTQFTGSKANGSMKVGGKFTAFDGYISGTNLKLIKDKKILQAWTSTDFPKGYVTEATFEFKKVSEGTKLIFTQSNVPVKNLKDIANGWKKFYWQPLQKWLDKK